MNKKQILITILLLIIIIFILIVGYICINKKGEDNSDTKPYLLSENCKIIQKDIEKGMTIKDNCNNEWVWVVVPKSKVFLSAQNNKDYEIIEKDIKNYTKSYSSKEHSDNSEEDTKLKENTLKSIYEYGGFWISRYEIGNEAKRNKKDEEKKLPLSQPNLYVYNYVTLEEAKVLATQISNKQYESNLLFGFQWDLVCKFIEENAYMSTGEKITKQMINRNSNLWGNYYTSRFTINNGKYSIDYGNEYKEIENGEEKRQYRNYLLTTGASEQNKACNIYDFAGNVSEWTLEKSNKEKEEWNIIRDGNFYFNYGGNDPVSGRYIISPNSSNASYGFRISCIKTKAK